MARVQSCHKKFDCACVHNVHVGGTHYAYIMFIICETMLLFIAMHYRGYTSLEVKGR